MHPGFPPTKPLGCQEVSAQRGHENTTSSLAKGLGGALGFQCFHITLLWNAGVSSRHWISAAKGWHLLLRYTEKTVRCLAEPKKVLKNNWVECADLDIWRKMEKNNRRVQGKRTNREINRRQKWVSHGAWPGCLRVDARFCCLLWTPEWGPVCWREALGVGSAVPHVLQEQVVIFAVSWCWLCLSPKCAGQMLWGGEQRYKDWKRFPAGQQQAGEQKAQLFPSQIQLSLQDPAVCHLFPSINLEMVSSRARVLSWCTCSSLFYLRQHKHKFWKLLCLKFTSHCRVAGTIGPMAIWGLVHPPIEGGCTGPGGSLGLLRTMVQAQLQAREITGEKR